MNVTCPNCQTNFEAKRRPDGTGTQPDGSPLTERENWLAWNLKGYDPLTIRDIQKKIFGARQETGGYSWNYHLIQATLSKLAGRGIVAMTKAPRGFYYQVVNQ